MFHKIISNILLFVFKIVFEFEVKGKENIPSNKNFIVVSNHISNLDPPILGVAVGVPLTYMAKEELFENKLFALLIKKLGAFPINRKGGDIGAIKTALRILQDNRNLVIFPEGGRNKTPEMLKKGKSGAALISVKSKVGIVPIGISANLKFRGKITVSIGEYIDMSEYFDKKMTAEKLQNLTNEVIMPCIANLAGARTYGN